MQVALGRRGHGGAGRAARQTAAASRAGRAAHRGARRGVTRTKMREEEAADGPVRCDARATALVADLAYSCIGPCANNTFRHAFREIYMLRNRTAVYLTAYTGGVGHCDFYVRGRLRSWARSYLLRCLRLSSSKLLAGSTQQSPDGPMGPFHEPHNEKTTTRGTSLMPNSTRVAREGDGCPPRPAA